MKSVAVDRLNEGQRDCLRLVLAHLNSKEIARELGVSPHTVDQRLRTAMRILNAQSRFEAARIFASVDQESRYQPLIYQSAAVEMARNNRNLHASAGRPSNDRTSATEGVATDDRVAVFASSEQPEVRRRLLPFPGYRGEKNRLATIERLGWRLGIALGAALSFGGLLAGLEALSRLKG